MDEVMVEIEETKGTKFRCQVCGDRLQSWEVSDSMLCIICED